MPPPPPYFKVDICPLPLPHFASIFFAYLWSFRWPNYIVTLTRYFRLPHLNINTGPPSDELDKNIQRKSHFLFFSQWNRYNHFRFALGFFICIRNSLDRPCVTMIFEFAFKVGRLHVLGYFALLYSNISFQSKDVTCVMFLLLVIYAYKVTNREYRRGNQKLTIQRNWQHRVHKTKTNKTKTQHNMHWTPLCANKHKLRK
jgi:hypothetical protein